MLEKAFPGKGREYAETIRDKTLTLYHLCAGYAKTKGIIIVDTKFEFGLDEAGEVVSVDEILAPDSPRFWSLEGYTSSRPQPSFDKQSVRDWPKVNPDNGYELPQDVIDKIIAKYKETCMILTGEGLN